MPHNITFYYRYTVKTKQRLYGTRTVFHKNYEILGGKV
jgi:hypothetical protein